MELQSGKTRVLTADLDWNVEGFVLSVQRDRLVYSVNEGGVSKLHMLSVPRHRSQRLAQLPQGILGSVVFSPDGNRLALSMTTTTSPSDVFVMDLRARTLTRWTQSEVGGLDTSR